MFDESKVAQMTAFFLKRSGGKMQYIKAIKLLYLAERLSLDRYHMPMSGDRLYSLPKGPIVSTTYNIIKEELPELGKAWGAWVNKKVGYYISSKKSFDSMDELDELSEADIEILEQVWKKFGWMSYGRLIEWTHDNCREWIHPGKSSTPIQYAEVFSALGYQPEVTRRIVASIAEAYSDTSALAV
jgi:uncharacterized phage-associated protein